MTTAEALAGNAVQNDSLARVALEGYCHGSDSLRKAEACYAAALTYRSLGDERRALGYFRQAGTALQGATGAHLAAFMIYRDWGLLIKAEPPYAEAEAKLTRAYRHAAAMTDGNALYTADGTTMLCVAGALEGIFSVKP